MSGIYRPVDPWGRCPEVEASAKPRPLLTDHIPALRGLLSLARGNYATVTPRDIQAAVDAGYVHPDVLSAVADEIAYATGRDDAEIEDGEAFHFTDEERKLVGQALGALIAEKKKQHSRMSFAVDRPEYVRAQERRIAEVDRLIELQANIDKKIEKITSV